MKRSEAVLLLDQTFGAQKAQEIIVALSVDPWRLRCDEPGCGMSAGFAAPDGYWCAVHEREHRQHHNVKVPA